MRNQMEIVVETDKRVNIYALWEGKQIILCKETDKYTHINGERWIGLWPSVSLIDQLKMLEKETPIEATEFMLSDNGINYLKQIYREDRKNNFIAKVDYVRINGRNRELWNELNDVGEFTLWDIDKGPVKYYEKKGNHLLSIYRIYKIGYVIDRKDIVPDKNGNLPSYNKKLNEFASKSIIDDLKNAKSILSDEDFNRRKKLILDVIKKYPPEIGVRRYEHKPIFKNNSPEVNQKQEQSDLSLKYCFNCGIKLISEANYCIKCGKKQPTLP